MANNPKALDTPEFSVQELEAARAHINAQRKNFKLQLDYMADATFTSSIRGDVGPLGGESPSPEAPK